MSRCGIRRRRWRFLPCVPSSPLPVSPPSFLLPTVRGQGAGCDGWRGKGGEQCFLPLKRCTLSLCFVCLFVCLSVCFWCVPLPHGGCCCVLRGLLFHLVAHELPCRERWTPQRSPHRRLTPQRCCRWPSIGSFGRCALAPHGNVFSPLSHRLTPPLTRLVRCFVVPDARVASHGRTRRVSLQNKKQNQKRQLSFPTKPTYKRVWCSSGIVCECVLQE